MSSRARFTMAGRALASALRRNAASAGADSSALLALYTDASSSQLPQHTARSTQHTARSSAQVSAGRHVSAGVQRVDVRCLLQSAARGVQE
jgi:hypothetical protein